MPVDESVAGLHSIRPPWLSGGPRGSYVVVRAKEMSGEVGTNSGSHTKP